MLFQLEAEAYVKERLHTKSQAVAATPNIAPTTDEQTAEPAITHTIETRQEGPTPANTNPTPEQQKEKTTLLELEPTCETQQEALATLNSAETHTSPIPPQPPVVESTNAPTTEGPPPNQHEQTQAPDDILGILEED